MCPIWPLHLIILYLLALCPLWVICQQLPNLAVKFTPDHLTVNMNEDFFVDYVIEGDGQLPTDTFTVASQNEHIASAKFYEKESEAQLTNALPKHNGTLKITGNFLGNTSVAMTGIRGSSTFDVQNILRVIVIRPERVIDTVFVVSIATFISLIFINFGCAMDWPTVKEVIRRPVGPIIGLCGQFLFMPLMTFGLGYLIFPDSPELHLGMYMTGVAPGGGASNIWTYILGGNLNLSLAMTTISTLASFGFIPLWLFSLGQVVFRNANIVVPYMRIVMFVVGLLVPLSIGLAMQRYTPKLAKFMVRILKGFSTTLLIFIIVFAIVTNLYIFELFTWQILVAGMGIPWLGYLVGYVVARLFRQPHADALAISIETGIQNTGIAIFLLRYTLTQPAADLTTVIPVSAAIMTPIPMTCIYIYQKIKACILNRRKHKKMSEEEDTPRGDSLQPAIISTADLYGKSNKGLDADVSDQPDVTDVGNVTADADVNAA